jgi:hypothetical protein
VLGTAAGSGNLHLQVLGTRHRRHARATRVARLAVLRFDTRCPRAAGPPTLDYRLLFDIDPTHRGLLTIAGSGLVQSAILSPEAARVTIDLAAQSILGEIRRFLLFGFDHILLGYHGISFASALGPMQLPALDLVVALGCFNLGVESGQVALALLLVPIAFVLRVERIYPRLLAPLLSAGAFSLAALWFVDRVVALNLLGLQPAAPLLSALTP